MRNAEFAGWLVWAALLGYLVGREQSRRFWLRAYERLVERYGRLLRQTPPETRQDDP